MFHFILVMYSVLATNMFSNYLTLIHLFDLDLSMQWQTVSSKAINKDKILSCITQNINAGNATTSIHHMKYFALISIFYP